MKDVYWVYTTDLGILAQAWKKPFADIKGLTSGGVPLICADFDHISQMKDNYRVYTADLGILATNWKVGGGPDPNCP
jgi:hypothetical protein